MRKPLKLVAATVAFLIGTISPTYASAADSVPVTTIAGTGAYGTGGDNADATQSALKYPIGLAVDAAGNAYIADSLNDRIQMVDTNGAVTTFAGTGTPGAGGDNADATQSALDYPTDVAIDAAGNVYIADAHNHRIQKVDTTGAVTTYAGTGTQGAGTDNTDATQSALNTPWAVAADSAGNVYIADTANHRIQKIDTTGAVTTYAGTGTQGAGTDNTDATQSALNTPHGVAIDAAGNVYIADTANHRIQKIDTTGAVTTYAGTGTQGAGTDNTDATQSALNNPHGVAVDTAGDVYIADTVNHRIRKVEASTTVNPSGACDREITGTNVDATGNPGAIARIYMATFKRQPDSAGQAFWTSQREADVTLKTIANFFVNSDEFTDTYDNLNDTEFIDLLYENVMCRTGETEGATFWTGLLDDGSTRADIVLWFSQSPEFKTLTATN